MLKRLLYIFVILLWAGVAKAQQLPIFSQYLYNKFLINPAVAGSDGYTSYSLTAREQWVGLYGAPQTFAFSGQTRIMKKKYIVRQTSTKKQYVRPKSDGRIGLGAYVFSDRSGLMQRTGFQLSYAYHMWIDRNTQLSMGLAFTGYQFKLDEKQIDFHDPNEPWMNSDMRKGVFIPDAAAGVYILNAKYNAGFSVDQLFGAALKLGDAAFKKFQMARQVNIFGAYTIEASRYGEIQPSFIFRMSTQLKPQADAGLTYIYKQSFWAGLTYRTSGAAIAMIGAKYQNLWFGYSVDFTLQEIQRVTYGTHEFTVAMKFGDNSRRYRWLDRY